MSEDYCFPIGAENVIFCRYSSRTEGVFLRLNGRGCLVKDDLRERIEKMAKDKATTFVLAQDNQARLELQLAFNGTPLYKQNGKTIRISI